MNKDFQNDDYDKAVSKARIASQQYVEARSKATLHEGEYVFLKCKEEDFEIERKRLHFLCEEKSYYLQQATNYTKQQEQFARMGYDYAEYNNSLYQLRIVEREFNILKDQYDSFMCDYEQLRKNVSEAEYVYLDAKLKVRDLGIKRSDAYCKAFMETTKLSGRYCISPKDLRINISKETKDLVWNRQFKTDRWINSKGEYIDPYKTPIYNDNASIDHIIPLQHIAMSLNEESNPKLMLNAYIMAANHNMNLQIMDRENNNNIKSTLHKPTMHDTYSEYGEDISYIDELIDNLNSMFGVNIKPSNYEFF